jgi:hypothetical protein
MFQFIKITALSLMIFFAAQQMAVAQVITGWKNSSQVITIKSTQPLKTFSYTIEIPHVLATKNYIQNQCQRVANTACDLAFSKEIISHNLANIRRLYGGRIPPSAWAGVSKQLTDYVSLFVETLFHSLGDNTGGSGSGGGSGPVGPDGGNGGNNGGFNLGDWCANNGGCDRGGDGAENSARITRGVGGASSAAAQSLGWGATFVPF